MDAMWIAVIVLIVAVVAVAVIVRSRQGIKLELKGPAGIGLDVSASNPEPLSSAGVTMDRVRSTSGTITAEDNTGRGADMRNAEAYGDIRASSSTPNRDSHPKV